VREIQRVRYKDTERLRENEKEGERERETERKGKRETMRDREGERENIPYFFVWYFRCNVHFLAAS